MLEEKLNRLAEWSVELEISGTAISNVDEAREKHIQDSLSGLDVAELRAAASIIDIGSGAGFPGLVLAAALPETRIVLVDSVRKKMEAASRIARELELTNLECVWGRAEEIAAIGSEHREAHDVVTARALAPLAVLLEYAAPLLRVGGSLVAWKGSPDAAELAAAERAATKLDFAPQPLIEVKPFADSQARHFYVATKRSKTPDSLPRRPGMALKRPLA